MSDGNMTFKRGTLKLFSVGKGYGFIIPDGGGGDVFFHKNVAPLFQFIRPSDGSPLLYQSEPDNPLKAIMVIEDLQPGQCCPYCGRYKPKND